MQSGQRTVQGYRGLSAFNSTSGGFNILAVRYPEKDMLLLIFANLADWDRYVLMLQIERIVLH